MKRQHVAMLLLPGLTLVAVMFFLARCPPEACRALHIQTYTVSRLDEYQEFLADEAAFQALHRVRAVRLNCSALRDDVVTALNGGRLALGITRPMVTKGEKDQHGPVQAWHQGRLLHVTNALSEQPQEMNAWMASVREKVAGHSHTESAFLSRLFGGVILHGHHAQTPIVLFSDDPCV
ncbi:MAG: hypothetical protein H0V35_14960 [Nitrospira sp.]|nr:hypothetical protein [Nitrospira sp.]